MTDKIESLTERILYPEEHQKKNPSKIPLWVHWVGRIGLIILNGGLAWWLWTSISKFWGFTAGFIFVYQIVILLFGYKIREWMLDILSKY